MSNELTEAINKIVNEKTFSLDALKVIEDLRTKAQSLEKTLETKTKRIEILDLDLLTKERALEEANKQALIMEKENQSLKAEQSKAKESIAYASECKAVADAYRDALYAVFKPNAVRETIHRSIPVAVQASAQMPGYVSNYVTEEEVTKEG